MLPQLSSRMTVLFYLLATLCFLESNSATTLFPSGSSSLLKNSLKDTSEPVQAYALFRRKGSKEKYKKDGKGKHRKDKKGKYGKKGKHKYAGEDNGAQNQGGGYDDEPEFNWSDHAAGQGSGRQGSGNNDEPDFNWDDNTAGQGSGNRDGGNNDEPEFNWSDYTGVQDSGSQGRGSGSEPEIFHQPDNQGILSSNEDDFGSKESNASGVCRLAFVADASWVDNHSRDEGGVRDHITNLVKLISPTFEKQLDVRLEVAFLLEDKDNSLLGSIPTRNGGVVSNGITGLYKEKVSGRINLEEYCAVVVLQGNEFEDNTTGVASIDAICSSSGIAVVKDRDMDEAGQLRARKTLTHELGHIFGAKHDQRGHCENQFYIMQPGNRAFENPNIFNFSPCSLSDIERGMSSSSVQNCLFGRH